MSSSIGYQQKGYLGCLQHFRFWWMESETSRPPNFLFAAPRTIACAAFSKESRMKFVDPTRPYRKFGSRLFHKTGVPSKLACWGGRKAAFRCTRVCRVEVQML
jgi:hypothetical protein